MYIVVIENTAKKDCHEEYRLASCRFMNEMKEVPGVIDAKVWQDRNNPEQILNVIVWESEAMAKSNDGSLFLKYKPELKPYFETNTTRTFSEQ